jgi:hypothetical protein
MCPPYKVPLHLGCDLALVRFLATPPLSNPRGRTSRKVDAECFLLYYLDRGNACSYQ